MIFISMQERESQPTNSKEAACCDLPGVDGAGEFLLGAGNVIREGLPRRKSTGASLIFNLAMLASEGIHYFLSEVA